MRLRSGLHFGESGGNQTNQDTAVPNTTAMAPQDDDFSTRAEAGTPHPSFSTNGGERSPISPGFGEGGPSNYQDSPQSFQNPFRPPYQGEINPQDFQLFSTPPTDPNQSNDEEMRDDQISLPEAPRQVADSQNQFAPTQSEQRSHDSYFLEQNPPPAPTHQQVPLLQNTTNQTLPGMIPVWEAGPAAWSPVSQTPPGTRKRSLVQENPTQDLEDYPKDRNFQDKMEEDLDSLKNGDLGNDSEEESRSKKRRKRSTKLRTLKPKNWEDRPRDDKEDGENGQGGGKSMFVN